MKLINLTWAIIWGIMFVASVAGFFWNPAHFITAAVSAIFCGIYINNYIAAKSKK